MDWFRWKNSDATDPRWRAIAKRAGVSVADVLAVRVVMMTYANKCDRRGHLDDWSEDLTACLLDIADASVVAIRSAMEDRGLIVDGRLTDWKQPVNDESRPSPSAWAELRAAVFERDDYTCQYCGERAGKLECDHVIPVSRGGHHHITNLITACFTCNRAKRDRTPEQWRAWCVRNKVGE